MPKRFSRYNFALKAVDGAPPAGSPAAKYKDYKSGVTKPTYVRAEASNPGELKQVFLTPFSTTGTSLYAIQYSKRAADAMGETGLSDTALNISADGGASPLSNPGYSPAKATVQVRGTGATTETSKITGVQYKTPTGAASYTFPFGRKGDSGETSVYTGVGLAIRKLVEAKQPRNSVSFTPEKFRL